MKILYNLFFVFTSLLLFTNCASRKNFVYFQDNTDKKINAEYPLKLKKGDILNIKVFGCDEESIKIFNIPTTNNQNANRNYFSGGTPSNGYLINKIGEIDFPLIGKIKLSELSIEEATDLIKFKLNTYLKDPKVSIQIQNFKITILGDVKNPGTIEVPNEKITLIEAIGIAGDLNITAKRKNILLLRDENGIKKQYRIDLTNSNFINSPIYCLEQNDIIYVEANQAKINSSNVSGSSSILVAIASLVITTVNILTK
jgi:polysaccharide export outer membrane protein